MTTRWTDYVIASGGSDAVEELWRGGARAGSSQSIFLLGVGFDPRALVALQQFLATGWDEPPIIGVIGLPTPTGEAGVAAQGLASANQAAFEELVAGLEVRRVDYPPVREAINAGPTIARTVTAGEFLAGVEHLVIDISSLPSGLYFPLIAACLTAVDRATPGVPGEVQVAACENPEIDGAISELGVSEAALIGGFRGALDRESEPAGTVIWAPVLGENAGPALTAIHDFLAPGDVCPVLPFPARNPRRADNLLLEHQVALLDAFRVTPGNVIYADERNPFDLYRTLSRVQEQYKHALRALEPTTIAVSTHSSKVLSLGALLAAYEHKLPVVAASAADYDIADVDFSALSAESVVTCAWLTGEPYRPA